MLSAVCCWGGILFLVQQFWVWSLDAVSRLLLSQRPGVSSDSLIVGCCQNSLRQQFNAECAELRLVRWWACSGSNRLCSCLGPIRSCFLSWVCGWWCQWWMRSDGRFWYISCWWSQMFVSEASSLVVVHQMLFLRWTIGGFWPIRYYLR
jgi:hypothetical protein